MDKHQTILFKEFLIKGIEVYIRNKTDPEKDSGRNIPSEDFLFSLPEPNLLTLGSSFTQLNLVLLIPKTDKR